MISVILAGGKGIRLWPESNLSRPKQMCDFFGRGSLLRMTLRRLQSLGSLAVVCRDEQRSMIEAEKKRVSKYKIETLYNKLVEKGLTLEDVLSYNKHQITELWLNQFIKELESTV